MTQATNLPPPAPPGLAAGGSNRPIPLDRPDQAWLVESGYADVFALHGEARQHLFRAEVGTWLFGVPCLNGGGLLAVGSLGSQLRGEFAEAALCDATLPEAGALERWVRLMTEAVSMLDRSWPYQTLEAGPRRLPAQARVIGPAHGLVWVTCLTGEIAWCGVAAIPEDRSIPLTSPGWLGARVNSQLLMEVAPPHQARLLDALTTFNALALAALAERRAEARAAERRRGAEREARADERLATAFRRLAGLTGRSAADVAPVTGDPLLDALTSVCQVIGHALPLPRWTGQPTVTSRAEGQARLTALLTAAHINSRPVSLEKGWWRRDGLPLLGWLDGTEPAALLPTGSGGWRIHAQGSVIKVDAYLAARLGDDATQIYPSLPDRPVRLFDLFLLGGRPILRDLVRAAVMAGAAALLALAPPIATGMLFDTFVPLGDRGGVAQIIIALFAFALGQAAFTLIKSLAILRLEGRLDATMQAAVFDRLLRLPAGMFRRYNVGDLTSRALGLQEARMLLTQGGVSAVLGAVFGGVSLVVMAVDDWRLALVGLVPVVVTALVAAGLSWGQLRQERERTRLAGLLDGFILQMMVGISKLRAAAAEKRALTEWAVRDANLRRAFLYAQRFAGAQQTAQSLLTPLGMLIIFGAALYFMQAGPANGAPTGPVLTAGVFAGFSAAFGQLTGAIGGAALAVTHMLSAVTLLERTRPLLEARPEGQPDGEAPQAFTGRIALRGISFRYAPDLPPVLRDLTLGIEPGQFVAIVGPSGSGKSTIMRLLLGFERPDSGNIYFDGQSSDRLDLAGLRRQIGVVLQNGRLTAGSIYENIGGNMGLSLEAAWAAARLVNLAEDVEAMPMGMHTFLSNGAQSLSGGQRQRILLARALARRPRLLMLDEATSALDNRTQAIVTETMASLNMTRIVIAHRLSTIKEADQIFVLDRGRVVQSGTFETLINQEGTFAALARRQLL